MNIVLLVMLALATAATTAWAVVERGRAGRAFERARLLEENAGTLKAQAAQSAQFVAEALVRRAGETFEAQEKLSQAKLEAQLKPVAETLAKFQEQAQAAEKARAEETGGLKHQI
jgi:DNA recombination protein RmuC